jgi:adenylate cyclase
MPQYEALLTPNTNWAWVFHSLAQCKFFTGSIPEAIPLEEQAIRVSPRDPLIGSWYRQIGLFHLVQSRANEAVVWFEKARNAAPASPDTRANLASADALACEIERAAAELAEARRLSADGRFSNLARLRTIENFGALVPKARDLLEATYIAGLRKTGMPEE